VTELATVTVEQMSLVSVGTLMSASETYFFALLDSTDVTVEVDVALLIEPALTRDERTVPARMAGFTVPAYINVDGQPRATTGLVVDVAVTTGVGAPVELEAYPEPRNVPVAATARWLPLDGTLIAANTQWLTYSEYLADPSDGFTVGELGAAFTIEQIRLYRVDDMLPNGNLIVRPSSAYSLETTTGAAPAWSPSYAYYRDGGRVRSGAVSMDKGSYLFTDDIVWGDQEVTVIAVVVLRAPDDQWYGILETASPLQSALTPYFGLRYSRDGFLALHSDGVLASIPLVAGSARPAQPVVVGFNINISSQEITLMAIDDKVTIQRTVLSERVDFDSRLYVGRSPLGQQANANMDVLEVAYFTTQFGQGDLAGLMAQYDRMYGVTTS
jgi:hypothetical protein